MRKHTRRDILFAASMAATAKVSSAASKSEQPEAVDGTVLHIVFFWLQKPESKEALKNLIDGLYLFKDIPGVKYIHVGTPDQTKKRDVVDSSYSASIVLQFDSESSFRAHMTHPLHEKFVSCCGALIKRALVYDPKRAEYP